jgi:hypothetical protein
LRCYSSSHSENPPSSLYNPPQFPLTCNYPYNLIIGQIISRSPHQLFVLMITSFLISLNISKNDKFPNTTFLVIVNITIFSVYVLFQF